MPNIKQTRVGRILCWLGIHALITAGRRYYDNGQSSAWGGCVRCNAGWQWDS